MNLSAVLISVAAGYLLGSIPFGYLLVRRFRGEDIRTTGSGNIGATNVARTSPLLGMVTLLLDGLKGMLAVGLMLVIFPGRREVAFIAALAAICGHIFPVWLGFRGGKGVATGLGSFLLLTPKAILIGAGIFLCALAAFRRVAMASILAAASLPFTAWLLEEVRMASTAGAELRAPSGVPLLTLIAGSILVVVKHHANIRRMVEGTEPKFSLKKQ
jgi:acyl phosphate:glycerol-3-phosphate acyltransferase